MGIGYLRCESRICHDLNFTNKTEPGRNHYALVFHCIEDTRCHEVITKLHPFWCFCSYNHGWNKVVTLDAWGLFVRIGQVTGCNLAIQS